MTNELSNVVQELLRLGRVAKNVSDVHKAFEPSLTITWHEDGTIDGEFYSYCLDLSDGGRHHTFGVADELSLISVLKVFITEAKEDIQKLKEANENTGRMENEGG